MTNEVTGKKYEKEISTQASGQQFVKKFTKIIVQNETLIRLYLAYMHSQLTL